MNEPTPSVNPPEEERLVSAAVRNLADQCGQRFGDIERYQQELETMARTLLAELRPQFEATSNQQYWRRNLAGAAITKLKEHVSGLFTAAKQSEHEPAGEWQPGDVQVYGGRIKKNKKDTLES